MRGHFLLDVLYKQILDKNARQQIINKLELTIEALIILKSQKAQNIILQ